MEKMFNVKPEYQDAWFGSEYPAPVSESEIAELADGRDMTIEELMEQVEEI